MDELKLFLKQQQDTYKKNNTYEINLCEYITDNITKLDIDEEKFYKLIKEYRQYKLNYSQGKYYQDMNNICNTFCNRNNNIYSYLLLDRKNINYNNHKILVNNKNISTLDLFSNKKEYIIEENYEVLTVHINENLKLLFEVIGEQHQIKIMLSLENNIPNTYFEEYIREIDTIINSFS